MKKKNLFIVVERMANGNVSSMSEADEVVRIVDVWRTDESFDQNLKLVDELKVGDFVCFKEHIVFKAIRQVVP